MKKVVLSIRKSVVLILGGLLVVLGIILIPLPGPGVLLCLAGFFVLSTEFDWAHRPLERARDEMKKIYYTANERAKKVEQWGDGNKKEAANEADG